MCDGDGENDDVGIESIVSKEDDDDEEEAVSDNDAKIEADEETEADWSIVFVLKILFVIEETPVGETTGLIVCVFVPALLNVLKRGVLVREPVIAALKVSAAEKVTKTPVVGDTESLDFIEAYTKDLIEEGDAEIVDILEIEYDIEGVAV